MVSVILPSDALSQHLLSYLDFSYLGLGVSLHGCSSKEQPLLLTLDERYLLTAALPDLECGVAPLGPPAPSAAQFVLLYNWEISKASLFSFTCWVLMCSIDWIVTYTISLVHTILRYWRRLGKPQIMFPQMGWRILLKNRFLGILIIMTRCCPRC